MPRRKQPSLGSTKTELLGLSFSLSPAQDCQLYPQYAIALHAWLLDQVRQADPHLSAALHDGESEKPFALSRLEGITESSSAGGPKLQAGETYRWVVSGLSKPVVQWMRQWVQALPEAIEIRQAPLQITTWEVAFPPTTYADLLTPLPATLPSLALNFISPTGFRHRGHHLPLPLPKTVFQSYLRRWNDFSGLPVDADDYLDWLDESVIILRHQIQSLKVVAGKRGSMTGFVGAVEFGLTRAATADTEYAELWMALGRLAPYCGTGHKNPFGLGQTRLGWPAEPAIAPPSSRQTLLAQRMADLTEQFIAQRKRTGGDRATHIAETWATILARRELGESLYEIANDLDMPYETVKTYSKLARRAVKDN
jgi:CRISPR-associated endoribonuclease Cas6